LKIAELTSDSTHKDGGAKLRRFWPIWIGRPSTRAVRFPYKTQASASP